MRRILTMTAVAVILSTGSSVVLAGDARSIALGGAVIANGKGVHGAMSNPASMMAMQRRGETTHIRWGGNAEFRDSANAIDTLTATENEDLISDIEQEIDNISNSPIQCDLTDGSADCVTGTQELSDLSGQLLEIIDLVDGESIEGYGAGDLGMAYTKTEIPFAINLRFSASGSSTPNIDEGDRNYISEFNTLLDGDSVTLDEILNSDFLFVENDDLLGVQQPEDILESSATAGVMIRTQLGVSLAKSMLVGSHTVDVGITPKFSSLTAQSSDIEVRDEFLDGADSIADRFEDSEVTESSFTVDIGASMMLPNAPVRVAAVIRNLIPESITTREGFEFETTPQLIIGAAFQRGMVSVTGDLALNEAELDGFSTHKMGIGVEYGTRLLALRGGISHDAARTNNSTSLSLGFGLGPLEVGGRLTGTDSAEIGAQLAYSF